MIRKISTVTVCLTSNFAWDNFISCGIPQRKRFKSLPDIFCDLNGKDKINTDLASSFVISLGMLSPLLGRPLLAHRRMMHFAHLGLLLPLSFYCWTSRVCRGGRIQYVLSWGGFTLSQCTMALPTVCCNHTCSLLCGRRGIRSFFLLLLYPTQDGTGHEIVSQPVTGWAPGCHRC